MSSKYKSLSDVYGVEFIGDDFIISGNGDISFCYELYLPAVLSLQEDQYNDISRKLNHYIGGQNSGVVFHFMNVSYIDKIEYNKINENYTNRLDGMHFLGKPFLKNRAFLIVSYPTLVKEYFPSETSSSFIKPIKLLFDNAFEKINKASSKVRAEAAALENEFSGNDYFKIEKLGKQQITDLIYNIVNASFDDWQKDVSYVSVVNPIEISERDLRIGREYIGVVTFQNEPAHFSSFQHSETTDTQSWNTGVTFNNKFNLPTSISYPINLGSPVKHIVHTIITTRTISEVSERIKKDNTGLSFLRGIGNTQAKSKEEDIAIYMSHIASSESKPCTFAQMVVLYANDTETLNKYSGLIRSNYKKVGSGVESYTENLRTSNLYFCSLPGVARENFMYNYATVNRAVNFIPVETHLKSDKNGFNFCDRFGNRVVVNLKKRPGIASLNFGVFGPTGTGKSVTMNTIVSQAFDLGYHTIILDVGGSYKTNAEILGGKYIDCGIRSSMSFNIFDCQKNDKGEYIYRTIEDEDTGINKPLFIHSLLSKILYGDAPEKETEEAKEIVLNMIVAYYDAINKNIVESKPIQVGFTGFQAFCISYLQDVRNEKYKKFFDIDSFELLTSPYVKGGVEDLLLNGTKSFDIKSDRFVVFDVQSIAGDKKKLSIVSSIVVDITEQKLRQLPLQVSKIFLIDEALDFLQGKTMGEYIAGMYRKIRKQGGQVGICMQDSKFLDGCADLTKSSISANMNLKMCLGLPNLSSKKDAQILMGYTDKEIELIDTVQPMKEIFLKVGKEYMILQNNLSPETLAVFTTDPTELGVIREYKQKYPTIESALNNYLDHKKN